MARPADRLAHLGAAWDAELRPSVRRALVALVVALVLGGAHVARFGVLAARVGALVAMALALLGVPLLTLWLRRKRGEPRAIIRRTVARVDPPLGAATLRALTLSKSTAQDPTAGSPALAELHLARLLGRAPSDRIEAAAAQDATRWSTLGLLFALAALIGVFVEPLRIVEGFDVLAARGDQAPLPLEWLDGVEMIATPPEYLNRPTMPLQAFKDASAPRGTRIEVRGRPVHPGRPLLLSDGTSEQPFFDDGTGHLVAHYVLAGSTRLFVTAAFGPVRIRQVDRQALVSIEDELPKVLVEGAPRTVKLIDEPRISIHYEATDDHGLREIDLVLRSGAREERRVLSRPAADARVDRGGVDITARDAFFNRTYAPVEVTVEARDNDAVSGPKWGKSAPILIVLPAVGEPEALRYAALLRARDALTDLLAARLEMKTPSPATRLAHRADEANRQHDAEAVVRDVLAGTHGGLTFGGRAGGLMRAQLRKLGKSLETEKTRTDVVTHDALLAATESVVLAIDSARRGLGARDSRAVARRLADVADEVAAAASTGEGGDTGIVTMRLDAAVGVLGGGGGQLVKLGELGRDLGEIVGADLRRIERGRAAHDMFHTELAARDLAARLRRPEPSFTSSGGHAGVESGVPNGRESGESPSEADQESAELEAELERLTRDHASELSGVEQAMNGGPTPEELEAMREAAKPHAQAIRDAVKGLPGAAGNGSASTAAGASGRQQAEAMAGALEHGDPKEAVDRGKQASKDLGEAKKLGEMMRGFDEEQRLAREAAAAKETIDKELAWAQDELSKMRQAGEGRAKGELGGKGEGERRLAERARDLARRGEGGDGTMPDDVLQHLNDAEQKMRAAEHALKEGTGQQGLSHQKDAQRLLEMALGERDEKGDRNSSDNGMRPADDGGPHGRAEIPGKERHKGPEEFRRRVLDGLGGSADPALREAVRRYAEGLLR